MPRRADDVEVFVSGCPSCFASADEHNEAFARINWRTSPVRVINRVASVDASGCGRGDVSAVDELSRALLVSYRHAS